MANSVHQNIHGPDWPLGNIVVPVPGTPVAIMNLVDSTARFAPESGTATVAGSGEYTRRAQQIIFQGVKAGGGPPKLVNNTGNVYVIRKALAGAGGITDVGTVIAVIAPGQTFILGSAPLNRNVFNLYAYYIDADNANDACQVTAIIQ